MFDQPFARLDKALLHAGQRPAVDTLRQHQAPLQVAQVVGQHAQLQSDLVAPEAVARQPRPVRRLLPSQRVPAKVPIQVTSEPEGSEIFIDGRYVGSTPSREMVSEGEHTLKVTRPGFTGWERKVTLEPGNAKTFNAILTKQE
jgi:hypothetical protein